MNKHQGFKSRFKEDAEDGQLYDRDHPVTEEDERKAQDIWAEITGKK